MVYRYFQGRPDYATSTSAFDTIKLYIDIRHSSFRYVFSINHVSVIPVKIMETVNSIWRWSGVMQLIRDIATFIHSRVMLINVLKIPVEIEYKNLHLNHMSGKYYTLHLLWLIWPCSTIDTGPTLYFWGKLIQLTAHMAKYC